MRKERDEDRAKGTIKVYSYCLEFSPIYFIVLVSMHITVLSRGKQSFCFNKARVKSHNSKNEDKITL